MWCAVCGTTCSDLFSIMKNVVCGPTCAEPIKQHEERDMQYVRQHVQIQNN